MLWLKKDRGLDPEVFMGFLVFQVVVRVGPPERVPLSIGQESTCWWFWTAARICP